MTDVYACFDVDSYVKTERRINTVVVAVNVVVVVVVVNVVLIVLVVIVMMMVVVVVVVMMMMRMMMMMMMMMMIERERERIYNCSFVLRRRGRELTGRCSHSDFSSLLYCYGMFVKSGGQASLKSQVYVYITAGAQRSASHRFASVFLSLFRVSVGSLA